jgi:hypothetical protein
LAPDATWEGCGGEGRSWRLTQHGEGAMEGARAKRRISEGNDGCRPLIETQCWAIFFHRGGIKLVEKRDIWRDFFIAVGLSWLRSATFGGTF